MRYIDADKLKDDLINNRCFYPSIVESAIRNTPTADVVEVVRCRDCKHFTYDNGGCCGLGVGLCFADENQFCSYGERRERKWKIEN